MSPRRGDGGEGEGPPQEDRGPDGRPHVDPAGLARAEGDRDAVIEPSFDVHFGPAPNQLAGRQRTLVWFLHAALVAVLALAVATLVLPRGARDAAGSAMVICLVASPLVRVGWLVVRWARKGDHRFAATGLLLLAVVASALVA